MKRLYIINKIRAGKSVRLALLILVSQFALTTSATSSDSTRVFTEEHPLVYEDAWDLWPYTFLDEKGTPQGFNIDLLKLIFKRLDIPYVIKLKPTADALRDLKEGRSDLMLGMDAAFHNEYALYGESVIQLFTHSIVYPKSQKPLITTTEDLGRHKVIVHKGSFSHHLMEDKGWDANAIPCEDMKAAVKDISTKEDGQIVWNTLSLKWLINKYQIQNLAIKAVEMPHGEYKFMSNNPRLLAQLDSAYSMLRYQDQLQPIHNRWFYPERKESGIPSWIWQVALILAVLAVGSLIYYFSYRQREKKMTATVRKRNGRLSLILKTSGVRIWTYQVASKTFTMMDEEGNPQHTYSEHDFARHYLKEDFAELKKDIQLLIGKKTERIETEVTSYEDPETGTGRQFAVVLTVLRHDKNGSPSVIIGTRSDITDERIKQKKIKDTMRRYQAIFNNAMIDMVYYDENGNVADMNERACRTFGMTLEEAVSKHVNVMEAINQPDVELNNLKNFYVTGERKINTNKYIYYEQKLVPVFNENHKLLGIYGSGRDVTEVAESYNMLQENIRKLQKANDEVEKYIQQMDYVLKTGGVRIVTYQPDTHLLNIYDEISHVQYTLTQTRLLALVAETSKKTTQRILNTMDNLSQSDINADIEAIIRTADRNKLWLQVGMIPIKDANQKVTGYFGMLRDISKIKATQSDLEKETIKAQEVETVKNAFLRNMSYEIRTPLNTVVGFAELFEMEHSQEDEAVFISEIKESSSKLLKLINDILFLSRLDAQMIEIKPKTIDFANVFEIHCRQGWQVGQQEGVRYIVEAPYKQLVVDIDSQNLGIVIERIIENAVQHTTKGSVLARYDYIDDHLTITIDDTGSGITEDQQAHIFERFISGGSHGTGLGLSICHELIQQMNGSIRIKSKVGKGTTVWISVPCKVSEMERN